MARNVEIKAQIECIELLTLKVAALTGSEPAEIVQDDTFFQCEAGRLKLRTFTDGTGELIFYRRANTKGPKESVYQLVPTSTPDALREALSLAYGEAGRVKKHRTLFTVGRTRVHLDQVEGLGNYLELEVLLEDDEPVEVGQHEAYELMERLGVLKSQLVEGAYVDLLTAFHG